MSENNLFRNTTRTTRKSITVMLILLLFLLSFILSSCSGGSPRIKDVNYFQGIQGVEIEFLDESPPSELYEDTPFNINVILENRGAFDLAEDKYAFLSLSFDPFYIGLTDLKETELVKKTKNVCCF